MAKNFCLLPNKVEEFQIALKTKQINIADLINMSSEARTKLFENYAGANASDVNLLFEQKLVLKNRLLGIQNFASKVGNIGRYDPAKRAELKRLEAEYKQRQLERIFSPKENESFLADYAESLLGTRITSEEAKLVFDLSKNAEEKLKKFDRNTEEWATEKDRADYGAAKVVYENYVKALTGENAPVKDQLSTRAARLKEEYADNKARAIGALGSDALRTLSDNAIAAVASIDNSFLGRQGLKVLFTKPKAWWPGAQQSFVDLYKTMGGKNMADALWADIYSRPNYINGNYQKADLIPKTEEQYPTSLPAQIPGLGRMFTASETAFTGSAIRMRTALYDMISKQQTEMGVDMNDKYNIQSLGRVINSLTARGRFGKYGESPIVKLLFWAPRMIRGNWDVLTAHTGQDIAPFARKEARKNLLKVVTITGLIMLMINAFDDDAIEFDPRSSDFGKIKIGDTRFDITGGAASLVTLATRFAAGVLGKGAVKSTSTGIVTKMGAGYGKTSPLDVLINFSTNKAAPVASILLDIAQLEDFEGKPVTPLSALERVTVPLSVSQAIDLKDNASADRVMGVLTNLLGISSSSYVPTDKDWSIEPGKELTQFLEKVGKEKFEEANKKYNSLINEKLKGLRQDPSYEILDDESKQKEVDKQKDRARKEIFDQYDFKYKAPK